MKLPLCIVATLIALAGPARAQDQTAEQLDEAKRLYQELQVERAQALLHQVVSPASPFPVTPEQRVEAYLYLGASYATLQRPDSAQTFFRAALERDPFADLDPQVFTPEERNAFLRAKDRSFRVGIRPFPTDTVSAQTSPLRLDIVTTHEGVVSVRINSVFGDALSFPLYQGTLDGIREVTWNGNLPDGDLIDPGSYEVLVLGQSNTLQRTDSVRILFDVDQFLPDSLLLSDTLRSLSDDERLPERYPSTFAVRDLVFGLSVAAGAFAIPRLFGSGDLGDNRAQSAVVASAGVLAGLASFAVRSSNPMIPENIAENARRDAQRALRNQQILDENTRRFGKREAIIIPISGVTR